MRATKNLKWTPVVRARRFTYFVCPAIVYLCWCCARASATRSHRLCVHWLHFICLFFFSFSSSGFASASAWFSMSSSCQRQSSCNAHESIRRQEGKPIISMLMQCRFLFVVLTAAFFLLRLFLVYGPRDFVQNTRRMHNSKGRERHFSSFLFVGWTKLFEMPASEYFTRKYVSVGVCTLIGTIRT